MESHGIPESFEHHHEDPRPYFQESSPPPVYDYGHNDNYDCDYEYDLKPPHLYHPYASHETHNHHHPHLYGSSYELPTPPLPPAYPPNQSPLLSVPNPNDISPSYFPYIPPFPRPYMYSRSPILPAPPHLPLAPSLPSSRHSSLAAHAQRPPLPSARYPSNPRPNLRGIKRSNSYSPQTDYDYAPSNYGIIREGGWTGMKTFMEAHGLDISDAKDVVEAERLMGRYAELDARMRGRDGKGRRERNVDTTQRCKGLVERANNIQTSGKKQKEKRKQNHRQPAVSDPDAELDSCDELECEAPSHRSSAARAMESNATVATSPSIESEPDRPPLPPCAPSPPPACAPSPPWSNKQSPPDSSGSEATESETETWGSNSNIDSESEFIAKQRKSTKKTTSNPKPHPKPTRQPRRTPSAPHRTSHAKPNRQAPKHHHHAPPSWHITARTIPSTSTLPPKQDGQQHNDASSSSDDEYIGPKPRRTARDDHIQPSRCSSSSSTSSTSSSSPPSSPLVHLPRVTWAPTSQDDEQAHSDSDPDPDSDFDDEVDGAEERIAGSGEYITEYDRRRGAGGGAGSGHADNSHGTRQRGKRAVADWSEYRVRLC